MSVTAVMVYIIIVALYMVNAWILSHKTIQKVYGMKHALVFMIHYIHGHHAQPPF